MLYILTTIIFFYVGIRLTYKKSTGITYQSYLNGDNKWFYDNYQQFHFLDHNLKIKVEYIVVTRGLNKVQIILSPNTRNEIILQSNVYYLLNFGMKTDYLIDDFSLENHHWFFKSGQVVNLICDKDKILKAIDLCVKQQQND
jgi:hypothetical protein